MLSQLVAGFGGSSFSAFKTINSRLDTLRETYTKQPEIQRDVAYLREKIGDVESLDELMDDYRLWQTATTAFGLGENAFAKGLFKKLMSEDASDPNSLAKRMVDTRYKELASFFEYSTKGTNNFKSSAWVEKLVDKFVTRSFENSAGAASPAVQEALYFQRKAPEITSFYQILGDERLYSVVRSAANLPDSFSTVDIDRQVEILKSKFDIEDFKSPAMVGRMIERHLAISDAQSIQSGGGSTSINALALQTFARPTMTGFAPILNIDPTLFLKK
jgi:hypothetical protein